MTEKIIVTLVNFRDILSRIIEQDPDRKMAKAGKKEDNKMQLQQHASQLKMQNQKEKEPKINIITKWISKVAFCKLKILNHIVDDYRWPDTKYSQGIRNAIQSSLIIRERQLDFQRQNRVNKIASLRENISAIQFQKQSVAIILIMFVIGQAYALGVFPGPYKKIDEKIKIYRFSSKKCPQMFNSNVISVSPLLINQTTTKIDQTKQNNLQANVYEQNTTKNEASKNVEEQVGNMSENANISKQNKDGLSNSDPSSNQTNQKEEKDKKTDPEECMTLEQKQQKVYNEEIDKQFVVGCCISLLLGLFILVYSHICYYPAKIQEKIKQIEKNELQQLTADTDDEIEKEEQ